MGVSSLVRVPKPCREPNEIRPIIAKIQDSGATSLRQIAAELNAEEIRTLRVILSAVFLMVFATLPNRHSVSATIRPELSEGCSTDESKAAVKRILQPSYSRVICSMIFRSSGFWTSFSNSLGVRLSRFLQNCHQRGRSVAPVSEATTSARLTLSFHTNVNSAHAR